MIIWIAQPNPSPGPFLFLDRDGILNEDRPDYIKNRDELVFYADALEALRWLNARGIRVIIISNQSALHRGLVDWQEFFAMHQLMLEQARSAQGWIDAAFYCPHRPNESCSCRKPAPGMLLAAASYFRIPLAETAFIGDKLSDVAAAQNAGCLPVLVRRSSNPVNIPSHVPVYNSLLDAVIRFL